MMELTNTQPVQEIPHDKASNSEIDFGTESAYDLIMPSGRAYRLRFAVVLTVAGVLPSILTSTPASACSCIGGPFLYPYELNDKFSLALMSHSAVFLGYVESVETKGNRVTNVLEVEKWWKGPDSTHAVIITGTDNCSYFYTEGKRVIVFAQGPGPFYTGLCSTLAPIDLTPGYVFSISAEEYDYRELNDPVALFDAIKTRFDRIDAPMDSRAFVEKWRSEDAGDVPLGSIVGWIGDFSTGQSIDLQNGGVRVFVDNFARWTREQPLDIPTPSTGPNPAGSGSTG